VSTALLNRITDPDARRRLQEALLMEPKPETPSNGRGCGEVPAFDPRYRVRHWWLGLRPIEGSCRTCGPGEKPNWIENAIAGPRRTVRLLLLIVNLLPRAVRLWTALTGGFVDQDAYDERQAMCGPCPHRVIVLRFLKGSMREKSYCGRCMCPTWWLARLDIKNRLRNWRCPERRHVGSDPEAVYRVYALGKAAEGLRAATAGNGDDGSATEMAI